MKTSVNTGEVSLPPAQLASLGRKMGGDEANVTKKFLLGTAKWLATPSEGEKIATTTEKAQYDLMDKNSNGKSRMKRIILWMVLISCIHVIADIKQSSPLQTLQVLQQSISEPNEGAFKSVFTEPGRHDSMLTVFFKAWEGTYRLRLLLTKKFGKNAWSDFLNYHSDSPIHIGFTLPSDDNWPSKSEININNRIASVKMETDNPEGMSISLEKIGDEWEIDFDSCFTSDEDPKFAEKFMNFVSDISAFGIDDLKNDNINPHQLREDMDRQFAKLLKHQI